MPRKATGTVYRYGDHWVMRITLADGSRGAPVHLAPDVTEEQARTLAARASARERETAAPPKVPAPLRTSDAWAEMWFADREARGQTSVKQDRGRWRRWISPRIPSMTDATPDDCETIVRDVDTAVREGRLRPKSAALVWALARSAFAEACKSKVPALRVRARGDNPTQHVRGPDAGPARVAGWLYPSEAAAVLTHPRVSRRWRRLIAVQAYTYLRPGELEALRCDAVDLDADVLRIHQARDYSKKRGATKRTKTKSVRSVPIEPVLRPLIEVLLHEARAEGRDMLLTMPPVTELSAKFRKYLRWAGITRADLFASDDARRPIRFRDLRATGITWRALRGDPPLAIQHGAGHTSFNTTSGYIRAASVVGRGVGAPFPPLPADLLETTRIVTAVKDGSKPAEISTSEAANEPHPLRVDGSDDDAPILVSTPLGLLRDHQAAALATAVTIRVTIPQSFFEACEAAIAALIAYARGDIETMQDAKRDFAALVRLGPTRRSGAPRYITDPRTGRTQTLSAWARDLCRTPSGLAFRIDTMPIERALAPARKRAA